MDKENISGTREADNVVLKDFLCTTPLPPTNPFRRAKKKNTQPRSKCGWKCTFRIRKYIFNFSNNPPSSPPRQTIRTLITTTFRLHFLFARPLPCLSFQRIVEFTPRGLTYNDININYSFNVRRIGEKKNYPLKGGNKGAKGEGGGLRVDKMLYTIFFSALRFLVSDLFYPFVFTRCGLSTLFFFSNPIINFV